MSRPVPQYTDAQIEAIVCLVGEAIDTHDCGLDPHSIAVVFGTAAQDAMDDRASADPAFLPLAESIARVRNAPLPGIAVNVSS